MSITADLIRGHTDTIILAALLKEDSYGYRINRTLGDLTDGRYELRRPRFTQPSIGWRRRGTSTPTGETRPRVPEGATMPLPKRGGKPTAA